MYTCPPPHILSIKCSFVDLKRSNQNSKLIPASLSYLTSIYVSPFTTGNTLCCVAENLYPVHKSLYMWSIEETFLEIFLEILKHSLQNFLKIFMKCFLVTDSSYTIDNVTTNCRQNLIQRFFYLGEISVPFKSPSPDTVE